MPVCGDKERNCPVSGDFLQPAKTAAMCYHLEGDTHLPLSHLVQNLSLKRIAPTETMQPKLKEGKRKMFPGIPCSVSLSPSLFPFT